MEQTGLTRQYVFKVLRDLTDMKAILVRAEKRGKAYHFTEEFIDLAESACNRFIDSLVSVLRSFSLLKNYQFINVMLCYVDINKRLFKNT